MYGRHRLGCSKDHWERERNNAEEDVGGSGVTEGEVQRKDAIELLQQNGALAVNYIYFLGKNLIFLCVSPFMKMEGDAYKHFVVFSFYWVFRGLVHCVYVVYQMLILVFSFRYSRRRHTQKCFENSKLKQFIGLPSTPMFEE